MSQPSNAASAEAEYQSAKRLHAEGQLEDAERIYRRLIETAPDHVVLLQRLTDVCYRTGRTVEAVGFARRAIAIVPTDPQMLSNLGAMLYQIGSIDEALAVLERALALQPSSGQTHTNLGMVLTAAGRREEALGHFVRAAELDPKLAAPHNNIGNELLALGRYEEAAVAFRRALERDAASVESWSNLGNALFRFGRHGEAMACFERALALNPSFASAHYNWGTVLGELGAHDEAVAHYRRAREIDPSNVSVCNNLGRSLNALGRSGEAVAAFEAGLALDPDHARCHAGLGNAHLFLGRLAQARVECARAVSLAPNDPAVHRAQSEMKKYTPGDPQIAQMEALARRAFEEADRAELHFALYKAYADLGEHERAFASLVNANAAKRHLIAYDEAANLGEMRLTAERFTAPFLASKSGGNPSEMPVFIFGMPRSGTTLVEQILASHPAMFAAGETPAFGRTVVGSYRVGRATLDAVSLSQDDLQRLGTRYIEAVMAPAGKTRFTDKMPANFRFAGLIHMVLPRARLIHVRRDPLDTCFSCYTKLFNGALDYTYDLGELGRYYRAYENLMAHWRTVLPPGVMLDVRYEDLVGDLEAGARALLAHCGLDWDRRCLEFHKTERAVVTASTAQVRQPLYTTSIGRYKPYDAWLGPLRQALAMP